MLCCSIDRYKRIVAVVGEGEGGGRKKEMTQTITKLQHI